MAEHTQTLPHWDMTVVYPGLESDAFQQDFTEIIDSIETLRETFDAEDIRLTESLEVDEALATRFETVVGDFNRLLERLETIEAFIYSFVATDSTDELAQAKLGELEQAQTTLVTLSTRLTAWLGSLDVEALIKASDVAAEHAYVLRKAKVESEHLMSPPEEALAARLSVTGSGAWSRLHGDVSSQLMVSLELEGDQKDLPMSAVRNLAYEADRTTRRTAYEAELATWQEWRVPLAASLNSIKGEVNVLSEERGWESALERSLFQNSIDRATLDAMLEAGREAFPDFRRYMRAKAKALGIERMTWYDMFAPMPAGGRAWGYEEATGFILEHFGGYGPRLQALAQRAFEENWIDAEPRPGKRDGAFCMGLRQDESRILANYQPSYDGMSTLAHELGHAYHNLALSVRTPLQRETPMTLAETASTFCQTIIQKEALKSADEAGQMFIVEAAIQDACQVVVDISSRLQFESEVFSKRHDRPLSADEFCQLMLQSQADTYGDGLDPELRHAYMWAVKGHYYSGGRSFYNYPYMFGLLFGLGLYARYQHEPDVFRQGYDDLLSATGMADAAELAAGFDIDIRTPDFWRASLDVVREDIDRFESLVEAAG